MELTRPQPASWARTPSASSAQVRLSSIPPSPTPRLHFSHRYDVLLASPQDNYSDALAKHLQSQGFSVVNAPTAQAAIAHVVAGERTWVIVTSNELPDLPGIEALIRLRDIDACSPIALIAREYDEACEEVALECGAAEFFYQEQPHSIISKRIRLLAAGVKSPTKKDSPNAGDVTVGPLTLKSDRHRALWRGKEIRLTVTEFRIVRLLACQADTTLSYREIYDIVHGSGFRAGYGTEGYRTNVRSLIRKIRMHFIEADSSFRSIENNPGIGYFWRRERPSINSTGYKQSVA